MISYKDAGVNKEEGYRAVDKIKDAAKSTHSPNVLTGLGSFGSMYALGQYKNPVLVSGTDGVGTKLEVAIKTKNYDTVGQDCVAMVVNDILCHGAKPLFFLDYLACGKLDSDVSSRLVIGMANACKETGTALVGGETAEMPGFYKDGDYDIAGFAVGVVEKDEIITGDKIKEGDIIIALKSNGLHSNGFSLVRKLVPDFNVEFEGAPIHEELLKPTRLYVKPVLDLLKEVEVSGIAHITGGGLEENVPRIIPEGLQADIKLADVKILPIFKYLASKGVNEHEMFGTFNMGVGMILVVDKSLATKTINSLISKGEDAYIIGEIKKGDTKICLR
ncbi:MAG: phosphoribosylformylglycinamidine cyclo-ligase [Fusobacteriaceae bacterium]|nr:phosphoribosylformylglycinamidine cyclo-ligase [Fusobacteriaceae bacterium]